jgi:N-methylhydantoinase A/oxoprolinase/acetone carboxylase beta subunit
VNAYVRAFGREGQGGLGRWRGGGDGRPVATEPALFAGRALLTPRYERARLPAGWRAEGPAIVFDPSATTLVPPGWRARLDELGVLHMERAEEGMR